MAASTTTNNNTSKTCFVTIGATATFTALIQRVLAAPFISALKSQGYTQLVVQYGAAGKPIYESAVQQAKTAGGKALSVSGFDLDKAGLGKHMRQAKGGRAGAGEGVVVSHAGSGTILDALRLSVPIIVVPNAELLDNHQVELAEALAAQEYVVHGRLEDLPGALKDAEALRQRQREWPPANAGTQREARGLKGILDEEMGFLD